MNNLKEKSHSPKVAVAGTFDFLHKGHEKLLEKAVSLGCVTLGLTSTEMAEAIKKRRVFSFEKRKKELKEFFLKRSFPEPRIVKIKNRFGPALKEDFDFIVVSPETYNTALAINKKREKRGDRPIKIIKIDFVLDKDGERFSSTKLLEEKGMLRKISETRIYFRSLRPFIAVSSFIFIFFSFVGYFSFSGEAAESSQLLDALQKIYGLIADKGSFLQFLFVVVNNIIAFIAIIALGFIFGLVPVFSICSNGYVLGMMANFIQDSFSWGTFIVGVAPHGIIEIPALIVGSAAGLKIGKAAIEKFFIKKEEASPKKETFLAFKILFKFLIPLIITAAAIEIFITARLIS